MNRVNSDNDLPSITPETSKEKDALLAFIPLAEIAARKAIGSTTYQHEDFRELVNVGLIKINSMISDAKRKNETYNPSYVIQGVIWEIKGQNKKEAVQRGEFKNYANRSEDDELRSYSLFDIQDAVFETVLSYEDAEFGVADTNTLEPSEAIEVNEMKTAIREAIALLPDNYRQIIEMRFYKNMKGVEIADLLGLTPTRITRVIQDALDLVRERLLEKRLI